jgi:hypothetical protein
MTVSPRTLARSVVLAGVIATLVACASAEPSQPVTASAAGSFGEEVSSLGDWNGALSDTTAAPPVALPQTVFTAANGDNWVCRNTQVNEKKNLDQLLNPGSASGVLYPGALIQGRTLIDGTPAAIPLPRSPIDVSIDLGVEHPSRTVDDPTSASVQEAVAALQRAADSRLGSIDVVPARVDFQMTEVHQSFQFMEEMGVYAKGSIPTSLLGIEVPGTVSLGIEASGGASLSFVRHTIAVKLMQPMYTVSFADEQKLRPDDYLASTVTDADVQYAIGQGLIGPDNLPTYVKSVTYGRMVIYTMTNTTTASTSELQAATQAALNLFKLASASGGQKLSLRDSLLLANSELRIVAFGGSQDSALAAIRTGDLGKFFTSVPATQAVPLGYRINYLKTGRVALLGIGTTYTTSDCTPAPGSQGRYWHVRLDSLTSNGGCDSADYIRRSYLLYHVNGVNVPYPLLDVESGPMADTAVGKEVVLLMPNTTSGGGGSGFTLESEFWPGTSTTTCGGSSLLYLCQLERDFTRTDAFAVNPYAFRQTLTLYGPNDGCTVTFDYEVLLEPALAPPAQPARRQS